MEKENKILVLSKDIMVVTPEKTSLIMRSKLADDKTILEVVRSFASWDASDITIETEEELTEVLVWTVDWNHSSCEKIPEMPSNNWSKN